MTLQAPDPVPTEQRIDVQFDLTNQDNWRVTWYLMFRERECWPCLFGPLILMMSASAATSSLWATRLPRQLRMTVPEWILISVVVALPMAVVVLVTTIVQMRGKIMMSEPSQIQVSARFDATGMTFVEDIGTTTRNWKSVKRVRITPDYVILFAAGMYQVVPRRAFATVAEESRFFALLEQSARPDLIRGLARRKGSKPTL